VPADLLAFGLAAALAAEPAPPADAPPVALIEFLGLWTTEDGRWIDPEALDALPDEPADAPAAGAGARAASPDGPNDHHPEAEGDGNEGTGNEGAGNEGAKDGGENDHD
jgi:hypothetical protein